MKNIFFMNNSQTTNTIDVEIEKRKGRREKSPIFSLFI